MRLIKWKKIDEIIQELKQKGLQARIMVTGANRKLLIADVNLLELVSQALNRE